MSFTSSYFIIDDIKSSDIGISGVSVVKIEESQIDTPWIGAKEILEDRIKNRDIPYHYGVKKQPLQFTIKFSILDDEYTDTALFELGRIFGKSTYMKFQTSDYLGKVFYIMPTSEVHIISYGSYKGWYEFSVRNVAPYAFTPTNIETFDFTDLTSTETFEINANFNVQHPKYNDYFYFPKLFISLKSTSTSITLTNLSDGGRQTTFTSLTTGETLDIDNELKRIVSSTGNSRISNFNKNWFRLVSGKNIISINNPALIQIETMFPVYL